MPSFYLRFVGSDTLPKSLSRREVEECFGLSAEDIHELRPPRFRGTARLGAAVQLVMLRATGRHPDALSGLPPVLLRHLTATLGIGATDIASITSLYKDKDTRFDHQLWARQRAGFAAPDDTTKSLLADALRALATTAVSVNDLVNQSEHWLFDRRIVLPGDRALRDMARAAFSDQENAALEAIRAGVPREHLHRALLHAFSKRSGPGGHTVLEWLRTPPGKHGQLTLSEVTKKIECLKALHVHEWNLSAIALNRLGIYVHMLDTWALFHDQPIVINDRQAAPAVHGVEAHNCTRREDQIRLSLLAVDAHGYTNAAMAIAKLLGFDLCVRLRQLSERKMFMAWGTAPPESLERLVVGKVSLRKIRAGWMELLRLIASIRQGRLTAAEAIARLGSAARGDPVHAAADELGKLLRTIFLCDYFTIPEFRREMHSLLNRGESIHQLQRAVYHGRVGVSRGRRADELRAISTSHTLLTNVVIAWNTMKMQDIVDRWKALKHPIEDHWIRRIGPVHFEHVNFKGTITFEIDSYADALIQRQPKLRARRV